MDEMFTAARGSGAFMNGERIRASNISDPSEAVLCVNQFSTVLQYGFSADCSNGWPNLGGAQHGRMPGRHDGLARTGGLVDRDQRQGLGFRAAEDHRRRGRGEILQFRGGSSIYGGNCVVCAPGMEEVARGFVAPA
jgi:hypothetical protein